MQSGRRLLMLLLAFSIAVISLPAFGQQVIATIPVGLEPQPVAVNSVTNKIYVANILSNTVTVIDGLTDLTTTIPVAFESDPAPMPIAVNPVTNKIYTLGAAGLTVIDGTTNSVMSVNLGTFAPYTLALNTAANKIYLVGTYSIPGFEVVDGATLSITGVPVGLHPSSAAVNPATNKIYVSNGDNTVTVVDGATLSTTTITVGNYPGDAAVNSVTNKIYVPNICGGDPNCQSNGTVSVIDGVTLSRTIPVGSRPGLAVVDR